MTTPEAVDRARKELAKLRMQTSALRASGGGKPPPLAERRRKAPSRSPRGPALAPRPSARGSPPPHPPSEIFLPVCARC